jgi:hypothetical protein
MQDAVLAVVSDLHTNSTVGLCKPYVELDDGGRYKASSLQRWYWRSWLDLWERYKSIKEQHKLPLVAIVNGDAADGVPHKTTQVITSNKATQLRMAVDVLEPVLDVADAIIIMRGTPAHTGKAAWLEEALAEDIGAVPFGEHQHSWWHLYAKIGGFTFDVKHHPETGSKVPWAAGAAAARMAAQVVFKYGATGDTPPDFALRAHRHTFMDSGNTYKTRVLCTPAW